ncbi:MAG TPA: cytochrome c3 family protein, partial [Bryobacteraceae bacterium]|nr:cytochrome c3 family protein [Bryobacteraceae bacterium]
LSEVWDLEEHKLGETSFTHFPDGTAHKNRMQGNDFVTSRMYQRGIACFNCHDVHGTENNADLIKPASLMCLECHGPNSPNGFRGTVEEHTHHAANSKGSDCLACHMPAIEQTIANVNVRSHTFRFITPAMSEKYKIPNACTSCHTDRNNAWATQQLKGWRNFSEWRVGD